jgi:hypothetical protein
VKVAGGKLGSGQYGTVYKAIDVDSGNSWPLRYSTNLRGYQNMKTGGYHCIMR